MVSRTCDDCGRSRGTVASCPPLQAIACVVLALIAIQYLLSGVIDRRSIETIFTINATRYTDRSYRHHHVG